MVEPLVGLGSPMLRRLGVTLLIVGVTLLMAGTLERNLNVSPRASVAFAALVGIGSLYTWSTSPQYAGIIVLLSTAVAVLLPVATCLHVFSELLVIQ
ncbi:MAG: hypothetical protein ABEJ73_09245 [Haloplanus sp.]